MFRFNCFKKYLYFAIIATLTTSCTLIFGSRYQAVAFYSNKPDTEVYIDGQFAGYIAEVNKPLRVNLNLKSAKVRNIRYSHSSGEVIFRIIKHKDSMSYKNSFWCTLDKFPGVFLIFPAMTATHSGLCETYNNKYAEYIQDRGSENNEDAAFDLITKSTHSTSSNSFHTEDNFFIIKKKSNTSVTDDKNIDSIVADRVADTIDIDEEEKEKIRARINKKLTPIQKKKSVK